MAQLNERNEALAALSPESRSRRVEEILSPRSKRLVAELELSAQEIQALEKERYSTPRMLLLLHHPVFACPDKAAASGCISAGMHTH